ncbi:hypothetical protein Droror1_Dr00023361 [Drosera rotundifolia]
MSSTSLPHELDLDRAPNNQQLRTSSNYTPQTSSNHQPRGWPPTIPPPNKPQLLQSIKQPLQNPNRTSTCSSCHNQIATNNSNQRPPLTRLRGSFQKPMEFNTVNR